MAKYSVELSDGTMDMGGLGRARVTTATQVEAGSHEQALALALRDGRPVLKVTLRRRFEVKLASKRDARRREVFVTEACNPHDAVRNVGYMNSVWRLTGQSLTGSTKNWPDAVLAVTDTTPDQDLGGASRLAPTTGQQLRDESLAAIQAAARRRRGRRRR